MIWVHMGFQRESGQGDVQKAEGQRIQLHLDQNIDLLDSAVSLQISKSQRTCELSPAWRGHRGAAVDQT